MAQTIWQLLLQFVTEFVKQLQIYFLGKIVITLDVAQLWLLYIAIHLIFKVYLKSQIFYFGEWPSSCWIPSFHILQEDRVTAVMKILSYWKLGWLRNV